MQNYEMFFTKNFTVTEDGNILLEQFVEFFMKEEGQGLDDFDLKAQKGLFKDLGELTVGSILKQCEELGVAMTEKEALKIVQMLNYDAKVGNASAVKEEAFLKALKETISAVEA
jgi:Ca2+-binding EF-hand superfamily protein